MKAHLPRVRSGGALLRRLRTTRIQRNLISLAGRLTLCGLLLASVAIAATPPEGGFPLTFVDQVGRTVTVRRLPQRIVSLAPSNTELAFAVGAGVSVVGVTTYCNYPEEARHRAKIGGFAARTISIESIVALAPDLVLAGDQNQRLVIDALERAGLTVASFQPRRYEEILATIVLLGQLTGCERQAQQLNDSLTARMQQLAAKIAQIPAEQRVRVYWEVFDQPLMSAGPRSIVGQAIALAGGRNVFDDVAEEYPQIAAEAIVTRDPQVIMGPASMRARSLTREALLARPGWGRITAVRDHRIIVLPDEPMTRAGPRFVDGVELMARTLYPALFTPAAPAPAAVP